MPRVHRILAAAALLALAGCKTIPKVEVVEVPGPTRYVSVDAALTAECPIEEPTSTAPMEAVRVANARKESLQDCNRRMRAIRALQGTQP
jgi:hypothetical protein